ncbi:MAG: hypothetical protein WCT77_02930 [Bacteroidota bacterium]|jgi:hypothetical protein
MIVTIWILFIFFGIMALAFAQKLFFGNKKSLNWLELLVLFISVFIVAIAAGVIFGGLTLL